MFQSDGNWIQWLSEYGIVNLVGDGCADFYPARFAIAHGCIVV